MARQGELGTNIAIDHLGNEMVKCIRHMFYVSNVERRRTKCQTAKRLPYAIKKAVLVRRRQQLILALVSLRVK